MRPGFSNKKITYLIPSNFLFMKERKISNVTFQVMQSISLQSKDQILQVYIHLYYDLITTRRFFETNFSDTQSSAAKDSF